MILCVLGLRFYYYFNHSNSAHQGHMEIVVLLIANGANLETTDEEGDSTLHFASFGYVSYIFDSFGRASATTHDMTLLVYRES